MGVQRRRVRVVVVDHGQREPGLEGTADVEAAPGRIDEVHRAPRRDHPGRAGRPRRVQTHRPHRFARRPGQAEHARERLGERLDGHRGTFGDPAGYLGKLVDQETPGGIEHGGVDGRPAVVEAYHDLLPLIRHPAPPRTAERTACGRPRSQKIRRAHRAGLAAFAGRPAGVRSSSPSRPGVEVTAPFATELLGWKPSGKNKLGWPLVPNFADVDNAESMRIAAGVLDALAVERGARVGGAEGSRRPAGAGGLRSPRPRAAAPPSRPWLAGQPRDGHHRFRSVRAPQRGRRAGPRQSRAADHDRDGLPDQAGRHGEPGQRDDRLGPAAAARGDLLQVDDPLGPGAEHPARVPADDPSPARPPAASGDRDRRAAAEPAGVDRPRHRRGRRRLSHRLRRAGGQRGRERESRAGRCLARGDRPAARPELRIADRHARRRGDAGVGQRRLSVATGTIER